MLLVPLWVWAAEGESTIVYRSVDAVGVVSFSDTAHPSATPVEVLPPPIPLREDVERANQQFEQQLALLEILEKSRHARAKEELEQRQLDIDYVRTQAAVDRAQRYENDDDDDRYYPLYAPYWGHGPRPPHPWPRPPHQPMPPSSPPLHAAFPR